MSDPLHDFSQPDADLDPSVTEAPDDDDKAESKGKKGADDDTDVHGDPDQVA